MPSIIKSLKVQAQFQAERWRPYPIAKAIGIDGVKLYRFAKGWATLLDDGEVAKVERFLRNPSVVKRKPRGARLQRLD